jgi:hypothetical protein
MLRKWNTMIGAGGDFKLDYCEDEEDGALLDW